VKSKVKISAYFRDVTVLHRRNIHIIRQIKAERVVFGEGKLVKLFLCFINRSLRHEDICESGRAAPPFLTSALDGN
jgi:hypothetical protein